MRKRLFVHSNPVFRMLAVAWAVAISFLGLVERTEAQGPIASPSAQFSSGMVGLASGQTARLNVVNIGVPATPTLPCVLVLAFVDSGNKALKQMFVSVPAGKAAWLDLTLSDLSGNSGSEKQETNATRIPIRGIGYNPLLSAGSVIPQPLSCNLVPTLELFNTETGRTVAIITDFRIAGSS